MSKQCFRNTDGCAEVVFMWFDFYSVVCKLTRELSITWEYLNIEQREELRHVGKPAHVLLEAFNGCGTRAVFLFEVKNQLSFLVNYYFCLTIDLLIEIKIMVLTALTFFQCMLTFLKAKNCAVS